MATIEAAGTLAGMLENRKVLPPGEAVELIRDVAGQAARLHAAGQVHGDIRGETITLGADGRPSLIGPARMLALAGTRRPADSTRPGRRSRCPQRLLDRC